VVWILNNSTEILNISHYFQIVAGYGAEFVSESNQDITNDVF